MRPDGSSHPRAWVWSAAALVVVIVVAAVGFGSRVIERLGLAALVQPPIRSLAVLPLANLSGDSAQEYLAEGIHEALVTDLAKTSGLARVIARSSTARYRGTQKPLREIGRELDVDAILTGGVLREGNRVRVTVQLLRAADEESLWAERYQREFRDVLSLQDDIVARITAAARVKLGGAPRRSAGTRKIDPEAYEAYLRGKYLSQLPSPVEKEKGLDYLRQAVQKDPTDPMAYAGLALAYNLIGHDSDPEAFEKARAAEKKALELDDSLAEIHQSVAITKLYREWDWPGAEREFQRALELNPGLPEAHAHYGWYLTLMHRLEEGLAEEQRAVEVDPLSGTFRSWLAVHQSMAGQHERAIAEARKAVELAPNAPWAFHVLGNAYSSHGMLPEAIAAHQKMAALHANGKWALAYTYAVAGRSQEARLLAAEVARELPDKGALGLARVYCVLGQKNEAFRWLEEAYRVHDAFLPWLISGEWGRVTDPLRDDPRFDDLLRRLKLPR